MEARAALEKPPTRQRSAPMLSYFEGPRDEELAEVMELPLNIAQSHVRRDKKRLAGSPRDPGKDHVRAQLLLPDGPDDRSAAAHVAACLACAAAARRSARLDAILRPMLVQAPPAELQARLEAIARAAAAKSAR